MRQLRWSSLIWLLVLSSLRTLTRGGGSADADDDGCAVTGVPRAREAVEAARLLRDYGAVVMEDLATSDTMDVLAADLAKDTSGTFFGSKDSFAGATTSRNAAKPLGESAVARELATSEKVLAVVDDILKPYCKRIILGTCSAIDVSPGGAPQVLHRDDSMWASELLCGSEIHFSVSVMWAVSDFDEANGATRVALHSHEGCPRQNGTEPVAAATMAKGSALLWLGGTLHGAGGSSATTTTVAKNLENKAKRRGLLFIYNLGFLRSEHNFHNAIPPDVIRSFPKDLRDLLGYDGQNAVEHQWYTGPVYAQPYLGGPKGSASGDGVQFTLLQKKNTTS